VSALRRAARGVACPKGVYSGEKGGNSVKITLTLECNPEHAAFILAFYILLHADGEDDASSTTISDVIRGMVMLAASLHRFTGDEGWSDIQSEQNQLDYIKGLGDIPY
jgi:hypothetical protein